MFKVFNLATERKYVTVLRLEFYGWPFGPMACFMISQTD